MNNIQSILRALVVILCIYIAVPALGGSGATGHAGVYSQTYGSLPNKTFLIYFHGGPGYNSASFELSAAENLGKKVFTIAYDRSSTGRSAKGKDSDFTFDHALKDIDLLLSKYAFDQKQHNLVLLGHSFGGTVALRYLQKNPHIVSKVILVNTPISYQTSLTNIFNRCTSVYKSRKDSRSLAYIEKIKGMEVDSKEYVGYLQVHSLLCGLHMPPIKTPENQALVAKAQQSPLSKWMSDSQQSPFVGFYMKERYSVINDKKLIVDYKSKIAYIQGQQDFSLDEIEREYLSELLGDSYYQIENAGHNLFFDQEQAFLNAVFRIVGV